MLSLQEAHRAARIPDAETKHDDDLTNLYIPTATMLCENIAGPIMSGTRVWTANGGGTSVSLPSACTSVTSVTENGRPLLAGNDYVPNLKAGIIYRGTIPAVDYATLARGDVINRSLLTQSLIFLPGYQNIVITYIAGYAAGEANVLPFHKAAARMVLAQLWQADLVAFRSAGASTDASVPIGFAVPARARELLSASPNVPGFA